VSSRSLAATTWGRRSRGYGPSGIVLVVNPAYCALYGRPADAFVGHSFARIFPETDQAMALDQYRAVFAAPDPPQSYAARIQRPDGSERLVEHEPTSWSITGSTWR
jgi:PAS domain S-box-containing protein